MATTEKRAILLDFEKPLAELESRILQIRALAEDNDVDPTLTKVLVSSLDGKMNTLIESNRGSFVAAALLNVPNVQSSVKDALSKHKKELKTKANAKDGATAGYAAVLKALES